MRLSSVRSWLFLLSAVLLLSGCSRFTKQYKCQLGGKPEPRSAYEYIQRSVEHAQLDELDCALSSCAEAIRLEPNRAGGYGCRGSVYLQQEKLTEALRDLDQAIKLDPENGDFYYSRGLTQRRLNEPEAAIDDFTQATQLTSSEFGRSVAYASRGDAYQTLNRLDEAIRDYNEAIKLSPQFAYHYNHRGDLYLEKGEAGKALTDYSAAIQRDSKNQYFYLDRAQAYRQLNQTGLAVADEATAKQVAGEAKSDSQETGDPIDAGDLTSRARSLPQPDYPPVAKKSLVTGTVTVQVVVDEQGNVISAHAISGHPLLQAASVAAARQAKFPPQPLKVAGTLTYKFDL